MKLRLLGTVCALLALGTGLAVQAAPEWAPVPGHIMTRWAKQVSPTNALPDYPRPQMVRKYWMNLNGLWDFAVAKKDDERPSAFDKKILVPYPVESALSGVKYMVQPTDRVWYKRTVEVPKVWNGKRILLHFGAVDWDATVYVNGKEVGKHTGGYDPFTFDITDSLKPAGAQEIVVSVWDPTDSSGQPHGKQVLRPGGIMYTGTTGIWQTTWLEPVAKAYIASYKAVPDIDKQVLRLTVNAQGATAAATVKVQAIDNKKVIATATGKPGEEITLKVTNPKLWSPDKPFLYDMKVTLADGKTTDTFDGYFGMRKISIVKDSNGINRLGLNNKVLFQYGPLDQGFWPDGIYTAPTDEALRYDIEVMKKFGCNMMRKHVKVEPDRLYYWADKLGVLVWQDMPAGGNPKDMRANFESELTRMIDYLQNHPSIVMWVVFNEGWGQYETPRVVEMVEKYDPSRLVNNASGWTDQNCGAVIDMHNYPGPGMPSVEAKRVAVLGEFGGLGRPIKGHVWKDAGSWGYANFDDAKAASDKYNELLTRMLPLIGKGLSAAVYTQTSDCEIEVNGMMTYDREVIKFDMPSAAAAAAKLYEPQVAPKVVLACADQGVHADWRYTTELPADNWFAVDFNDSAWKEGPAAFGNGRASGSKWETPDIWIRRSFELKSIPAKPCLNILHDEDAEIYINGQLAMTLPGYNGTYDTLPLTPEAAKLLKPGQNTLAIHCKQTSGAQCIDCGIVEPAEKK